MEPRANELVTCPFNPAHQVEHYRLQVHLAKCQKQHPNQHIATCPFDATHFIKSEELQHHVLTCPQRGMFDSQVYITDDDHRPAVPVEKAEANFSCSENWDDENVESYKPDPNKTGVPMYRKIKGATPSERKHFRYINSITYKTGPQQSKEE